MLERCRAKAILPIHAKTPTRCFEQKEFLGSAHVQMMLPRVKKTTLIELLVRAGDSRTVDTPMLPQTAEFVAALTHAGIFLDVNYVKYSVVKRS